MARNDIDIATTAFQMMGLLGPGEEISKNDFGVVKGHIGPSTTPESLMRAISPIYPGTQKQYGDTRCKWLSARTHRQCRNTAGHPGDHDWGQADLTGEDSNLGIAFNLCGTWREGRNCSLSKGHEGECFGDGLPIATLRDQFAIAAINGMTPAREDTISERAQQAYRIADAMLEARKPK